MKVFVLNEGHLVKNCLTNLFFIPLYMTFVEIISELRVRNDRVTQCFFFWDGPTMQHIEEVRRIDPIRAAKMKKPVCNTCRPGLLRVLHTIYGNTHFDYDEKVTDFYFYLMKDDKLSSILDPQALMGWIVRTAYYYFLNDKIKNDKLLENEDIDSLSNVEGDMQADDSASEARIFVQEVLAAMPNRTYAKILDEVTLEVGQYHGKEKADKMRQVAMKLDIPVDNLYVKVSLAKKQFKETAIRLNLR